MNQLDTFSLLIRYVPISNHLIVNKNERFCVAVRNCFCDVNSELCHKLVDIFRSHITKIAPILSVAAFARMIFSVHHRMYTEFYMFNQDTLGRYADRIANAKWEVKELGMEHNG